MHGAFRFFQALPIPPVEVAFDSDRSEGGPWRAERTRREAGDRPFRISRTFTKASPSPYTRQPHVDLRAPAAGSACACWSSWLRCSRCSESPMPHRPSRSRVRRRRSSTSTPASRRRCWATTRRSRSPTTGPRSRTPGCRSAASAGASSPWRRVTTVSTNSARWRLDRPRPRSSICGRRVRRRYPRPTPSRSIPAGLPWPPPPHRSFSSQAFRRRSRPARTR